MHVVHEKNLAAVALYASSTAAGIQSFDRKQDFIKASALVNAVALVAGVSLLYVVMQLPGIVFVAGGFSAGRPIGEGVSLIPFAIAGTGLATLNSVAGGLTAFYSERLRRATPIALLPNGTVGPDYAGIGRRIQVDPEHPNGTYLESCRNILTCNVITGLSLAAIASAPSQKFFK